MAFDRQNQTLPIAASQQDSFVNLKVIADVRIIYFILKVMFLLSNTFCNFNRAVLRRLLKLGK